MSASRCFPELKLHVFEEDGSWHWGLTIPRQNGTGFKVIAYSHDLFVSEDDARADGDRALGEQSAHRLD